MEGQYKVNIVELAIVATGGLGLCYGKDVPEEMGHS